MLASNGRVQKEKELYIRADKDARYGAVARVVAAARAAGVEGLNLLVQPEIEPEGAAARQGERRRGRGAAPRPGSAP